MEGTKGQNVDNISAPEQSGTGNPTAATAPVPARPVPGTDRGPVPAPVPGTDRGPVPGTAVAGWPRVLPATTAGWPVPGTGSGTKRTGTPGTGSTGTPGPSGTADPGTAGTASTASAGTGGTAWYRRRRRAVPAPGTAVPVPQQQAAGTEYQPTGTGYQPLAVPKIGYSRPVPTPGTTAAAPTGTAEYRSIGLLPVWLNPSIGLLFLALSVCAFLLASDGQIRSAERARVNDWHKYLAPGVLEVVTVLFILLGYRRAIRKNPSSPWPFWICAAGIGGYAIFLTTHDAPTTGSALLFGGASAILLILTFAHFFEEMRHYQREVLKRLPSKPPTFGALWRTETRLARRARLLAIRYDITTTEQAKDVAETWLAVYDDTVDALSTKGWYLSKDNRRARRLARRAAASEAARKLGKPAAAIPDAVRIRTVNVEAPPPVPAPVAVPQQPVPTPVPHWVPTPQDWARYPDAPVSPAPGTAPVPPAGTTDPVPGTATAPVPGTAPAAAPVPPAGTAPVPDTTAGTGVPDAAPAPAATPVPPAGTTPVPDTTADTDGADTVDDGADLVLELLDAVPANSDVAQKMLAKKGWTPPYFRNDVLHVHRVTNGRWLTNDRAPASRDCQGGGSLGLTRGRDAALFLAALLGEMRRIHHASKKVTT